MTLNLADLKVQSNLLNEGEFENVFVHHFPRENDIGAVDMAQLTAKNLNTGLAIIFLHVPLQKDSHYVMRCLSLALAQFIREMSQRTAGYIAEEPLLTEALGWLEIPHKIAENKKDIESLIPAMHNRWFTELRMRRNVLEDTEEPSIMDMLEYYDLKRKMRLFMGLQNALKQTLDTLADENSSDFQHYRGRYTLTSMEEAYLRTTQCETDFPDGATFLTVQQMVDQYANQRVEKESLRFARILCEFLGNREKHPDTYRYC